MELAANLLPVEAILTQFSLSKEQLKIMLKDKSFRRMVTTYKQEWMAATNAKERIRIKAAIATEEGLLALNDIFRDSKLNPTARLEAFKQLTALADVSPKPDAIDGGPKFMLTLNMGGDHAVVTLGADASPAIDPGDTPITLEHVTPD